MSAEPRAVENVHDSGKDVRRVHDDPGGSLRQRQSFPQQHPRGGRSPVHQCSAELAGFGGERLAKTLVQRRHPHSDLLKKILET